VLYTRVWIFSFVGRDDRNERRDGVLRRIHIDGSKDYLMLLENCFPKIAFGKKRK
jgi:hypothetical protein